MAVTVEQGPSVVLDEQYRVVEVNPAGAPWFGHHIGRDVFDCFPGSRHLYRPYYDAARRTGREVAFAQFFDGYVTHVTVIPHGAQLTVTWETLSIIDTWTLDGLRASLDTALTRLDELGHVLDRERVRHTLQLVRTGA
ncbi:MAG: hypothetical protein ACRDPV_15595 [Gaiellaceae bacterium]